jgi:hypothetical protein
MNTNTLFILELMIFSGVALLWAGYEWWSVRKPTNKNASASTRDAGHAEGEHEANDRRTEPPER